MEIDSIIDIKRKNVKSIIDFARFQDVWQKRDAARELNLSFATVSNIINVLMECGLMEQTEVSLKAVGRAPKAYRLVPGRFVIASMDIHTPDEVVLALINLRREQLGNRICRKLDTENIDGFLKGLRMEYDAMLAEAGYSAEQVIGVTAIIPGTYDTKSQMVVGTRNRLFRHQPLREMLDSLTSRTVLLENDANLAAFSIARQRQLNYLIYLYCGIGLGMGAVTEGKILTGANGYSVEISHAPFGNVGRNCRFCGHGDCLQEDVSRLGFVSKYMGRPLEEEAYTDELWQAFLAAVESGEERAMYAARDNARVLGRALSTAASMLRPELVMVGGLPKSLFDVMRPAMEEEINSRERYNAFIKVRLDPDFRNTVAIGGAECIYRDWYPDLDVGAE